MNAKLELKDLKPNLYFTLSDANSRKLCALSDQDMICFNETTSRYEFYTAIKYENNWWMVNTYQIPPIDDKNCSIKEFISQMQDEDTQDSIYTIIRYHYATRLLVKLDDKTIQLFDFVFDLNEMKVIYDRPHDYRPDKLVFVKLFNDGLHGKYLILAKKYVTKDSKRVQSNAARDFLELVTPTSYHPQAKASFDNLIKQVVEKELDDQLIEEIHRYDELINKLTNELRKEKANFEYIDTISGKLKREV